MKKYFLLLFVLSFFGCSKGQNKLAVNTLSETPNQLTKEQSDFIFEKTKSFPNNTQLSFAIIKHGGVSYAGIIRTNDTIKLIENHHGVFEIGSISKVFTATLLTSLKLEGKLKLTDPIQSFLGYESKLTQPVTFTQLSNHTSGLPRMPTNLNPFTTDPNNPYKSYGAEELKTFLSEQIKPNESKEPGYAYSNLGAGLLGFLLTEISSMSYEDLLKKYICSKYKMEQTTTVRDQVENNLVKGISPTGEEASNWDFDVLAGAGGIKSNVMDLSKFALAQFDDSNQAMAMTQQPTFTIRENMKIGLGWHLPISESGRNLIWHNGGTAGYTSSMALDKENKNGIIILSNVSAFNPNMNNIDQLCFGLVEMLDNP